MLKGHIYIGQITPSSLRLQKNITTELLLLVFANMVTSNSLCNANLVEGPLPAASYNELPHIDYIRDAASKHAEAHAHLLGLISSRGLGHHFSIHLIHKHFDVPDGRVMVYETVHAPNHPDFILCAIRDPSKLRERLRGLYFRASGNGNMAAYEYTIDPGEDLSAYTDFVAEFAHAVIRLGVQNTFALTAKKLHCHDNGLLTEFEMSDLASTVLVSTDSTWLPQSVDAGDGGASVPGIVTLKCLQTRAKGHYNVTCSATRSGKHYQQKQGKHSAEPDDDELLLDGQALPKDSEAYAVMSHARALVEAA